MKACTIKVFYMSLFIAFVFTACERVYDPETEKLSSTYKVFDSYFFLSDSLGHPKSEFQVDQDIFFNFGVINNRDVNLLYTKGHGGPPIVSIVIQRNGVYVGASDEGYCYPAIVLPGDLAAKDTLKFVASWNSNPFHENKLVPGEYSAIVQPYIWFYDFDLNDALDAAFFKIVE